jgi:myo-inositol 2-dehydrogenase/D-chiro-inositol 1-dehydrogenase
VGIVGAGFAAQNHARGYAALAESGVRLVAVADRHLERAQKLAGPHGAAAVPSLEAMLKVGVDLVSVCTPTGSHAALAIEAMRAGKHDLCEKPLARTVAEAAEMIEIARKHRVRLVPGHVTRFEPEHRKAREILDRGHIGQLRMATHSITAAFPDWNPYWYCDPAQSGGAILDLAIHSVDYLLWLFGSRPTSVCAVGRRAGQEPWTYALLTLRFENGGMALIETSWLHPPQQSLHLRCELVGSAGRIDWDYEGIAAMQVIAGQGARRDLVMIGEDSYPAQLAAFVQSVCSPCAPPVSAEEGLAALRVCLAALESLETGRPVVLS